MSKYAVDPRSELCFLDPKKMNSRRGSHFRKGEVFWAYNVLQNVCMFGGYFLMSRTFVIYKDAITSLPNLPQGVK